MKLNFQTTFFAILTLSAAICSAAKSTSFKPYASFDSPLINESSGLIKSRTQEGVYWTHNDSGDRARIFPVSKNGILIKPDWLKSDYEGIDIEGAKNIDWEDIATDSNGNLYIGAFGNNANKRKNLAIYVLPEPAPAHSLTAKATKRIPIAYPDQRDFPPVKAQMDFDSEALFHANGSLYLLSKNRGNKHTKLYRLDSQNPETVNTLTLLGDFNVNGLVTGADALPDGSKIAVLTYFSVWLFEKPKDSDNYLAGPVSVRRIGGGQCEAICFDDPETLLISNEQGKLYEIKLSEFETIAASE